MAVGERAEAVIDSSPARSSVGSKAGARSPRTGAAQVTASAAALELAQGSAQGSPAKKGSPPAAGVTFQVTERDGVPVLVPFDRTQQLPQPPLPPQQAFRAPSLPRVHQAGGTWGGSDPEAHFLKSVSCPGTLRARPPRSQGLPGQVTGEGGARSEGARSSTRDRGASNAAGAAGSPSIVGQETGGVATAFSESSTSPGMVDSSLRDSSDSGTSGSSATGGSSVDWDTATNSSSTTTTTTISSSSFRSQGSSSGSSGVVKLKGFDSSRSTNSSSSSSSCNSSNGRPQAVAPKPPRLKRTASLDARQEETRGLSTVSLKPGQGSLLTPCASVPPGASRVPAHPAKAHPDGTSFALSPGPSKGPIPRLPHAPRPPHLPRTSSLNVHLDGAQVSGATFMNLTTGPANPAISANTANTASIGGMASMEAARTRRDVQGATGMETSNPGVSAGQSSPGSLGLFRSTSMSAEIERHGVSNEGRDETHRSRGSDMGHIVRSSASAGVSDLSSAGGQGVRPHQDPLPPAASLARQGEPASDGGTFFLNLSHPHLRRPRRGTVTGLVASPDRPLGKNYLVRGSEAGFSDSSAHVTMSRAKDHSKGGLLRTDSSLVGEHLERQGSLGDILRQQQQRGEMRREAGRSLLLGSASLSGKQGRLLGQAADVALLLEDPEPRLWHGPLSSGASVLESRLKEAGLAGSSKHPAGPLGEGKTGRQPDTTGALTVLGLRLDVEGEGFQEKVGRAGEMGALDVASLADVPCGVPFGGQPECSPGETGAVLETANRLLPGSAQGSGEGNAVQGGDSGTGPAAMPRILSVDSGSSEELSKSLQACPAPRGMLRSQSVGSSVLDRGPLKSALKAAPVESSEAGVGSGLPTSVRKQVHFSGFVEVRQVIRVKWNAQADQGQA